MISFWFEAFGNMFFFSKSTAASYSTHFPLWVQQLEVLFCFICAVAKFNAVAGTTRLDGLHDNRKAFGLREMAHVFPGLTSSGFHHARSESPMVFRGFLMPRNKTSHGRSEFTAKKKSCPRWMFPKTVVPPQSSILIGISITNHPFWVPPYFWKHPSLSGNRNWVTTNGTNRSQAWCLHGILLELSVTSILCSTISTQTQKLWQGICHLQKWLEKRGEVWVSHFLALFFVLCFMKITQLSPGLDASLTTANHSKRVCLCCIAQGLCSQS